jgi:hypothetical protein
MAARRIACAGGEGLSIHAGLFAALTELTPDIGRAGSEGFRWTVREAEDCEREHQDAEGLSQTKPNDAVHFFFS